MAQWILAELVHIPVQCHKVKPSSGNTQEFKFLYLSFCTAVLADSNKAAERVLSWPGAGSEQSTSKRCQRMLYEQARE